MVLALLVALVACSSGVDNERGVDAVMQVDGAQYYRGAMPGDGSGPAVSAVDVQVHTVTAGLKNKQIKGALANGATAAAIMLSGDRGYWIVPAGAPDVNQDNLPALAASLSFSRDALAGDYQLVVRAVDGSGHFGQATTSDLTIVNAPIPQGTLVFTLEWDSEADLDLHVVIPSGDEIYRGNVNSYKPPPPGQPEDPNAYKSGGVLDFDSNASCQIDGRRQEDVVWTAPAPSGHYVVRVDTFAMCGQSAARWRVEARIDGNVVASAQGTENGSGTRFDHDRGAGVLALEIDVP
jgi:hypothetical protein